MKKTVILFALIAISLSSLAQDDLYYTPPQKQKFNDTLYLKNDTKYMQYCLSQYHKERQVAWCFAGAALAAGTVSAFVTIDSEINPLLLASGIFSLTSLGIFIDSDKWLRRGSMHIGPNGIRITF